MNQLLAPNGKPSNLTPEQWKLVRTPQFKAWFGDWENDPENASKVVDENGEPLVVYHGTYVENPFYVFDFNKGDLGFHFGTYEQAKNRSETKLYFKNRKSIINSFFLNIQNIYETSDIGEWEYPQRYLDMFISDGLISESDAKKNHFYILYQREDNKPIREYLLAKYGKSIGFVYNNKYEGVGKSFIVLNTAQIKLADGTNTTFNGSNPDIRFAEGGKVEKLIEQGVVDLKMYDTTPEHAREYGLECSNPLFIKNGIGADVFKYIDEYAKENKHDLIFGHIQQKAEPSVDAIKTMLRKNGYSTIEGNNDFYKYIDHNTQFAEGGKTKRNMKRIKRGGITYGKSHAEGGIPVKNQSTGDMLEVEGGEGIVNKRSMASEKKVKLNGREMTICEAVSQLNQMEGGVKFSCDDVSDRQFIEAMAKGGELERGTRTEQEHIQVLKDLYGKRITPKQATKRIAKDHLKEDSHYYSKLAKMEGKMADGGKVQQSLSQFGNEFEEAKKNLYSSNDAYQKSIEEGIALKKDDLLSQEEKDKLLEIARKSARANKQLLEEAKKGLTDLRKDSSPFYAPQFADGGKTPKTIEEAIDNKEEGTYKIKISKSNYSDLSVNNVDVILDINQNGYGTISFEIGTRNLYNANWKAIVDRVLLEWLAFKQDQFHSYVGKKSRSIEVIVNFTSFHTFQSYKYYALLLIKTLTDKDYYELIFEKKRKKTDKEIEDYTIQWSKDILKQIHSSDVHYISLANLIESILLNKGGKSMTDFEKLIQNSLLADRVAFDLAEILIDPNSNPIIKELVRHKFMELVNKIKASVLEFTDNSDFRIDSQLNTITSYIPYLAKLNTFDKDYIINIK